MGEVLSQNEIDNLLAALSAGELDVDQMQGNEERKVKNYDFSRPTKFSKEHLRTLEIIFEHYSRLVSTNLPVYLRKNVQVDVASSETVTFSEFTTALSNPVILGIINFAPLNGTIIIDLATNLGYAMLDRMLGGSGAPLEKSREFSEIELTILQKIMIMFTQLLREPWKNVVDINPVLNRMETNPQFAQVIAPNDMIAIITLNMKIGDVEGFVQMGTALAFVEGCEAPVTADVELQEFPADTGSCSPHEMKLIVVGIAVEIVFLTFADTHCGHLSSCIVCETDVKAGSRVDKDAQVRNDLIAVLDTHRY